MKILLIYHFFHPDPVISPRIFSDLAVDLARHGHDVGVYTGNRMIGKELRLAPQETWQNVKIRRFSQWRFRKDNIFLRLVNSIFLQIRWLAAFWRERKSYDAVIIGTDPQFSYLMLPWMRLMNHRVRLIHWVFDLYPEAVLASSPLWMKLPAYCFLPLAKLSYRAADDIIDVGECMKARLARYHFKARTATLTPWALVENQGNSAVQPHLREAMFGNAKLGLLYSGTIGRAHNIAPFIALARQCRHEGIDAAFFFAGCGSCFQRQTASITAEDTNIRIADYIPEADLPQRLAAADIHLVSLRDGWDGVVVPSKFFAALATGKPVLFSGSENSCISQICRRSGVGRTLNDQTTAWLGEFLNRPAAQAALRQHILACYDQNFSRECVCAKWRTLLESTSKKQDMQDNLC